MSRPETDTKSLTTLHWIAIGLTIITGVIHLVLGIAAFPGVLPTTFLLAGVGFFVGIGLLLWGYRRSLYLLGVPFVAVQIVLYLLLNQREDPAISPVEGIDKIAQLLLIGVLVVLYRRGA